MRGPDDGRPLLIQHLIEYAGQCHADTEIVSRTNEGPIHRYTYAEAERRSKRLAKALKRLGNRCRRSRRNLAWNGYRHYELYSASPASAPSATPSIAPLSPSSPLHRQSRGGQGRLLRPQLAPLVEKLARSGSRSGTTSP